jgi:PAS domain S-box-containing protein
VRLRQIAPVALIVALTVAGFITARLLAERDARRDSDRRAEVAAAQIRSRLGQAASLTESLRRFMLDAGGTGVTTDQFARNAFRWLGPAAFPAAAWVERVPGSRRAAYERRLGGPIVTLDDRRPAGPRSSYLAATLVSGFYPMAVAGIDLSGEPGMSAALARASRLDGVAATPVAAPRTGPSGLFLVAPAPNLVAQVLHPGYVVVFVPDSTLRAATGARTVQSTPAGAATGARVGAKTAASTFTTAGQRFDVLVSKAAVQGPAAVLPWIILAAGLLLAALAGALGINGARRSRAQEELDRIFTLSSEVIVVVGFDGRFTRVNPAAERVLGYTERELLARPYLDFVHPDDRDRTAAEVAAIARGKVTLSFENRYVRNDASLRVLEWTATPVPEHHVMYAVARDVTDRRHAEAELARLAGEQAALRRVATLVARGLGPESLFRAVTDEVEAVFGSEMAAVVRFEAEGRVTVMGSRGPPYGRPPGTIVQLDPDYVVAAVRDTGRAARFDTDDPAAAGMPEFVREVGIRSGVASPIVVDGRLWGAITAASLDRPLEEDTEQRLADLTELMATAVSNAQAREDLHLLADEQAALRRVATLVAAAAPQSAVCRLLLVDRAYMTRFDGDDMVTVLAGWQASGEPPPVELPSRFPAGPMSALIRDTGRPVRLEPYPGDPGAAALELGFRSTVAAPITVGGGLWGFVTVGSTGPEPPPPETEARLGDFTELVATAVSGEQARAELRRVAAEQAALRRVATLVAEGASPTAVFDAVAAEMERLLDADEVALSRYEPAEEVTVVAHRGESASRVPPGSRVTHKGESVTALVRRTERPTRTERYAGARGAGAEVAESLPMHAALGAPILVEGRHWGVVQASWTAGEPPPPDTEERMAKFAQLLGTAIANADSRDQLTASRARLLTEADEARRRVVRDLHDGAQQRLVQTILMLKLARRALAEDGGSPESLIGEALDQAEQGNAALRELAQGILPPVLTGGGLLPAVTSLLARLDLPVAVDIPAKRLPPETEANAYFIVCEALTNVVKHAQATSAQVTASLADGMLHVDVRDDGIGGADPRGHGLIGLRDRAMALGGSLVVDSPAGGGTVVTATLPVPEG